MKYTLKNNVKAGFSLVEMLVVIAVIGIIAAIAIPNIGSINGAAQKSEQQRNAQTIASLYSSSVAAGVTWAATSVDGLITEMQTGHNGTGPFANQKFALPQTFTSTDLAAIETHLSLDTAQTPAVLSYQP